MGEQPGLDVAVCLARVRERDEDAARALVEHLYPLVIKIVRAHLPRALDEEDLAQEIFMKVFANAAQYRGEVPFEHCQIHHVTWYTLGGLTDLENLLPVCNRHHHLVHEGGWQLHLAADRTLTITRPDGITNTHDPPTARAA